MVRIPRNDIQSQADISRIILLYKLPFQSVMLGLSLGLGLKAKIFGLATRGFGVGLGVGYPRPYVVAWLTSQSI